jgi:signal peptidase I
VKRRPWSVVALVLLVAFWVAGIGIVVIFDAYKVPTSSMAPTLDRGDRFLSRASDGTGLRRGDIVVFRGPPDDVVAARISRVIAFEGEDITADRDGLAIDGRALTEPYLSDGTVTEGVVALTVPAGSVYVLSDNRSNAQDSRLLGPVRTDQVIGVVAVRNVPLDWLAIGGAVLAGLALAALLLLPDGVSRRGGARR